MYTKILGISALLLINFAHADNVTVYRWVDKNNVVHYSQHQPSHNNYTELSMSVLPKTKETPLLTGEEKSNELATPVTSNSATNDRCESAKSNVQTLKSYDKIQYSDENGQLKVLSELEKSQQLEINEKQVEVYCREQ